MGERDIEASIGSAMKDYLRIPLLLGWLPLSSGVPLVVSILLSATFIHAVAAVIGLLAFRNAGNSLVELLVCCVFPLVG